MLCGNLLEISSCFILPPLSARSSEFLLHLPRVPRSIPDCYHLLRLSCAVLALCCGV